MRKPITLVFCTFFFFFSGRFCFCQRQDDQWAWGEPCDSNQPSRADSHSWWKRHHVKPRRVWCRKLVRTSCSVETSASFFPPPVLMFVHVYYRFSKLIFVPYLELCPCCFTSCGKIGEAFGNGIIFPDLRQHSCGILPGIIHSTSYLVQQKTCAFPKELNLKFPCRVSLIKFRE